MSRKTAPLILLMDIINSSEKMNTFNSTNTDHRYQTLFSGPESTSNVLYLAGGIDIKEKHLFSFFSSVFVPPPRQYRYRNWPAVNRRDASFLNLKGATGSKIRAYSTPAEMLRVRRITYPWIFSLYRLLILATVFKFFQRFLVMYLFNYYNKDHRSEVDVAWAGCSLLSFVVRFWKQANEITIFDKKSNLQSSVCLLLVEDKLVLKKKY